MRNGFMLIELIAILTFLIIIAGISIPIFSVFDRLLVRAELDTLYLTCASLQQHAQMTGQTQELVFLVKDRAYAWGKKKHVLHDDVYFGTPPNIKGPPSSPQTLIKSPVSFPSNKIVFHPDGIVQAGAVYLTDKANRFLCALTCPVAHISYVRRYIYQESWVPLP